VAERRSAIHCRTSSKGWSKGDYWVIDVPGVGTIQADSVDDIEETAIALVLAMTHAAPQDVHVQVRIV
jgi:hypothetical protein